MTERTLADKIAGSGYFTIGCVLCVSAFECGEPTGAFKEHHSRTERPYPAAVVYQGTSLCIRHFNVVRRFPADFVQHKVLEVLLGHVEDGPDPTVEERRG